MSKVKMRKMAKGIIEVLDVSHYDTTRAPYETFHPLSTVESLVSVNDTQHLAELRELAVSFPYTVDRLILSHSAAENRWKVIHALHSEMEWINDKVDRFSTFHHFLSVIDTAWGLTPNNQAENIRSAKRLTSAYQILDTLDYPEGSHIHGTAMLANPHYIALLLAHEEHLPELLQYRMDRNMDQTEVMEPHDEEDFARYLSQGPVRTGWL